ncbi:MAG: hypothetical protein CSA86_01155 [Arcobacter sp.]|nr:MAG: hypothetical protein CSA86_01155 [Arcobacter sp.]
MSKTEMENNKVKDLVNTYHYLNNKTSLYEVKENEILTIIDVIDMNVELQRELKVANNATLNYIKIGKSKNSSTIDYTNTLGKDATLNIFFFDFESSINRVRSELKNDTASININALIDLKDDAKVEYDIKTNHKIKSFSDISFTNLLSGKSSAKLNLFSIVEKTASFSKAFQNSKTILLSDDSFINVNPHLEIDIDELEASHGATCGDLDEDSIYYLESRGISRKKAKKILLNALKNELYQSLDNKDLSEYVKGLI